MSVSLKSIKLLWGRSGNRCAICKNELVLDPLEAADDESVIGDMAHIVAREENFTRGNYDALPADRRDSYSNLILLCKIHHKQIDDQPAHYTVERLHKIKTEHERWVRQQVSPEDITRQRDDEFYATCVQDFVELINVDYWTVGGTWICSSAGPQILTEHRDKLERVGPWLISRLWPHRYQDLEDAFANFRQVLGDFLATFNRHAQATDDGEWIMTPQFYRSDRWLEPEEYDRRVRNYEDHTALVQDLFFELTRALNYIFDAVRRNLLPSFRMREGAVLVERGPVGFDMHVEHLRPEYCGDERTAHPYPGLVAFKEIRQTRDFCIQPDDENNDWGRPS